MLVKIYINGNSEKCLHYIEKRNITKEELIKEIFANEIYCCQYSNKFVALNTKLISFIEMEE